ncbi:MAG: LysR family transcriptional regulator [Proteobacteria bacterium]|jgi:LysR family transcriptional regulator for metE and metH|nr:LysR family transcriptional regulator [Pseudomonadota bacterium]MDA1299834.1 LysR family transcriptional regulator [Pseudomonadota bacterium]
MIELRHLKTLVALRETGSLVEAANRLYLTQSALSHQLKDLEDRMECTLFVRKTRPPRFTSAGRRLLTLADEVLPMVRSAERDISRLAGGEAGRLHICIECHSCFQWLIPAIDRYRSHWPEVELDLTGGFNFEPLPALARADLDLVITSDPVQMPDIRYLPLFRYEALLAVGKQHHLAMKSCIDPGDLQRETLITYPVNRNRLDIFTGFLDPAGVEPDAIRTAELTPMMVQLVASGRGVACLPNWALTEYLENETIVAVKLGEAGLWSTLYAAIRDEQVEAPFMEDFIATSVETCFNNLTGIRHVTTEAAATR